MKIGKIVTLALKAIGLAMGVATVVLGYFNTPLEARVTMLGLGLFALALAAMQSE